MCAANKGTECLCLRGAEPTLNCTLLQPHFLWGDSSNTSFPAVHEVLLPHQTQDYGSSIHVEKNRTRRLMNWTLIQQGRSTQNIWCFTACEISDCFKAEWRCSSFRFQAAQLCALKLSHQLKLYVNVYGCNPNWHNLCETKVHLKQEQLGPVLYTQACRNHHIKMLHGHKTILTLKEFRLNSGSAERYCFWRNQKHGFFRSWVTNS